MERVEFAMYKGENLITTGTANEIAKELNISINSVHAMASPRAHRRDKGNSRVAVRLNRD